MRMRETRLKVHPAQKIVRENDAKANKGETALVQTKEREHPHFAHLEIKTYYIAKSGGLER